MRRARLAMFIGLLLFWMGLILVVLSRGASAGEVHMQVYAHKAIDAQTVNATAEVCTVAIAVSRRTYQSAQWIAASAGGTADVRVYVKGSIDAVNFMVPGGVVDLATNDTTEAWRLEGIYIPMVPQIKLCVKGNAANPADTLVTLWLAQQ